MGKPIFDCFDNEYKHPFGALRRGQPSIYNIRLPKTMHVTDLTLVMFRPGYKERFIELVLQDESGDDNIYSCCFTPNNFSSSPYLTKICTPRCLSAAESCTRYSPTASARAESLTRTSPPTA